MQTSNTKDLIAPLSKEKQKEILENMVIHHRKRIYICGKVPGEPREETEFKFAVAEIKLQAEGWETINPVRQIDETMEWKEAMRNCIAMLMECEAIYMLPCWPKSRGAILERYLAGHVGIEIIDA